MARMKLLENEIEYLLTVDESNRADDMKLYSNYCEMHGARDLMQIFKSVSLRATLGLASFESVSRVRRKLQEKNEDLRASTRTQQKRKDLQKEYRKYARS
ncbi:MAG: hypothetical protein II220_06155 [Spirochaetales bacterium]|nr:hypothetical protein [Spirochaetales bacterium]